MRIDELLENLNILIVYVLDVVLLEKISLHTNELINFLKRYVLRVDVVFWILYLALAC